MNISLKYYKTAILIPVIILLSTVLSWAVESLVPYISDRHIFRAPTNGAIVLALLWVYDQWGWKLWGLKKLVTVPNISGRYKGDLSWERDGVPGSKRCTIEIQQTASNVKVFLYTEGEHDRTHSRSISEDLRCIDGHYELVYYYTNMGSDDKKLNEHRGFNVLRIHFEPKEKHKIVLSGFYFTDRTPQTRGKVEVKFKSAKLKQRF